LLQAVLYYGDAVQVALVAISAVLAVVSVSAYRRRPEGRYLLLMLSFSLLCAVSAGTAVIELFTGAGPATVQFVEAYLVPSMELVMVVSFLVAILWSARTKRRMAAAILAGTISIGLVASAAYVAGLPGGQGQPEPPLPAGCARPSGGFLIVASSLGFNDSMEHGAPVKSWPILDVVQGTDVDITVCNTYSQSVGFQVTHYDQGQIASVQPGRVMNVNFVASEAGSFSIYCDVFNPIHIYLQGGVLDVS